LVVSDIDVRLLRVFRAVVESGGFSNAQAMLNVGASIAAPVVGIGRVNKTGTGDDDPSGDKPTFEQVLEEIGKLIDRL
jgi:hypothetical protein